MAKTITIKVTASDEGSLAKLVKQLKNAGHEIDMVATSHKRAAAAGDDHFHRQAKGVSGVANGTKSFSKMASTINGDNNSLVGAYAALAANIFAVTAAFNALKNAAEVEQVMKGLEASGVRLGLTYANTTSRVREAAEGLLSLEQSARSTAQILAAGFKADQVIRITEAAKNASFALGRDMTESMDRLTRGVIKLEPELLDELGIMVRIDEASATYARTLGKTTSQLTAAEKRQGFFNATLAEAELKFGGIADAAGGASGLTKLSATFSDLTNTIFKLINVAAKPLAAMFAASPAALLGGMLLFASSIKSQLMPGLVNSARSMEKLAKEANTMAINNIANKVSTVAYSDSLKDLFGNVKKGSFTMETATAKMAELRAEKDRMLDLPTSNKNSGDIKFVRANIEMVRIGMGELNKASAQTALGNAVILASNGKLGDSFKSLRTSIGLYTLGVKQASLNNSILTVTTNAAKIGMFAFAASARVAGVVLLSILPWLGVIALAFGAAASAAKYFQEILVGKEVLAARKEFSEIMKTLSAKEVEYARIRASTAAAASKEIAANILISNSINEQVAAIEKLIDAEKRRKVGKNSGKLTATAQTEILLLSSGAVQKAGYDKVLKEALTSPITEVREAARKAVDELGGIPEVLKDTETAAKFLDSLKDRLGAVGAAAQRVQEAFSALSISTADFIKSATPSTPYDGLNKSLTETIISLGDLKIEFAKGEDGAAKFAAVLSGLGSSDGVALLSAESAKALQLYKEGGRLSAEQVNTIQQELLVRQQILSTAQNEAIIGASLVQLASARVAKLNSFVALTASDTKKRMQAENAVLELQAHQLDAQIAVLKVMLEQAKARMADNVELRKSIGLINTMSNLQQVMVLQTALETEKGKPRSALRDATVAELQKRLNAAKQIVADEERIRNMSASTISLQNQAAAIRMGQTSAAVQAAEGLVTSAQTQLNIQKQIVSSLENSVDEMNLILRIGKAMGMLQNDAFIRAVRYNKYTLAQKILELGYQKDLDIARIRAQQARGGDFAILEAEIKARAVLYLQEVDKLNLESKTNLIESLGLQTLVERLEVVKKTNDLLYQQAETISANISAEAELNALKIRTAAKLAGRELTPTEERRIAFEIAEANLQAALDIQKLKELTIHSEYALLKAQYNLEAMKLRLSNKNMQTLLSSTGVNLTTDERYVVQSNIDAQTAAISAYEQAVGGLGAQQQAALRAVSINIETLREALKVSTPGLSGSTPNYVAATASATKDGGLGISGTLTAMKEDLTPFLEQLKKLGPDGEYVSAIVEGSLIISDAIYKIGDSTASTADKLSAVGSIIGQIGAILKASSDAKIANIDREIAAEQARDGKSESSLARIKAMESKKDAMARKAFEVNKKIMMAQAIIATATGITQSLALPPPMNFIMAGIIGAMGAAQLAVIAGTSYQSTSATSAAAGTPSALSVGSRGNSVDLARNNINVGGELGYLQGAQGQGSNSSNFRPRAYGGYGHAGMIVGEKGPERFVPSTPGYVTSNDNMKQPASINANFHINAIDAEGVEAVLTNQKGHIIEMLRDAANANGQSFLENVNTAKYRRGGRQV